MVEALKQSFMDGQLASASPLPWIWVIETLACSDQVDTSLLLDLLEKTPEVSDDHGRNARELVSLRILESLFVQGAQENSASCTLIEKIGLDLSNDSCEDVLRRILNEDWTKVSLSHLKPPFPEMSKWDLQPFIEYKKSRLTRHALQQMKNAMHAGKHSFLASLKEKSGLKDKNEPKHGGSGTNGDNLSQRGLLDDENLAPINRKKRAISENLIENDSETDIELVKRNKHKIICCEQNIREKLIPLAVDAQLADTQAKSLQQTERRICSLRTQTHVGEKEMDRPSNDDVCTSGKGLGGSNEVLPCDTELNDTSEAKGGQDRDSEGEKGDEKVEEVNISSDADGRNDELTDILTKDSKEKEAVEKTSCRDQNMSAVTSRRDSGKESFSNGKEASSRYLEDVSDKCTSLKDRVGPNEVLTRENQAPHSATLFQNDKCDGEERNHEIRNVEGDDSGIHRLIKSNEDMNRLQPSVVGHVPNVVEADEDVDTFHDSDGFHDERTNIATQKKMFLSSQCTYSQDSFATTDWRGLNLCVKCNLGGKLLVCGSDSCPLVIHQSCLGLDVVFDTTGKFYCPFCAYSQAISKYVEIKEKTALARKDLAHFFGLGTQKGSGKQSRRLYNVTQNSEEDDGLPNVNGVKRRARKISSRNRRRSLDYEQPGPSEHSPFERKPVESTYSRSPKPSGDHQRLAVGFHKSQGQNTSSHFAEGCGRSEKRANIKSKRGIRHSLETNLPHEKNSSHSAQCSDVEETSEQENDNSGASKYLIRVRKKERKPSYPAIPQLRRIRLPWTSEEEEKLKEGMRVHCSPHDKLIPWKKILEHGAGVFHQSRSTIDLKDKWRNMCKVTPKKSK